MLKIDERLVKRAIDLFLSVEHVHEQTGLIDDVVVDMVLDVWMTLNSAEKKEVLRGTRWFAMENEPGLG